MLQLIRKLVFLVYQPEFSLQSLFEVLDLSQQKKNSKLFDLISEAKVINVKASQFNQSFIE